MIIINIKHKEILAFLVNNQDWTTSNQIADFTNQSIRSVKKYINEINLEYNKKIILSSRLGYQIENSILANEILDSFTDHSLISKKQRIHYLVKVFLKSKSPIDLFELAEDLYLSISSIKADLIEIRKILSDYHLELINNKDFVNIDGLEKNKRKLFSKLLYIESDESILNYSIIEQTFPEINVYQVKEIILRNFNLYNVLINDLMLFTLIMHLVIALDRMNTSVDEVVESDIDNQVNPLVSALIQDFENSFSVKYSNQEIRDLAVLISSSTNSINYKNITIEELHDYVGVDYIRFVQSVVHEINAYYYVDLFDENFMIRLTLHIKNLLLRASNNYYPKNPLRNSVKTTYPILYDSAVYVSKKIQDFANITMNEDEISFIALHLGGAIETQKHKSDLLYATLYCPNYYELNINLADQINDYFKNQLSINKIINDIRNLDQINSDIIITTVPLNRHVSKENVKVNFFLSEKDISHINKSIAFVKKKKKIDKFKTQIKYVTDSSLFKKNINFSNELDAINYMIDILESKDLVNQDFRSDVLERERLSTTAFNNIAIPHSMTMESPTTSLFVLLNQNPIIWSNNMVSLVLLMSFSKSDRVMFNDMLESLSMIFTDQTSIKSLLNSNNYDEFIDILISIYENYL